MRRRYQEGSLGSVDGFWIAQWWEDGHRRKRTLGRVKEMTKTRAKNELAAIVQPINSREKALSRTATFGEFIRDCYLPFFRRKWKRSTAMTNGDRIKHHLISEMENRTLGSFGQEDLQALLDRKVPRAFPSAPLTT